MSEEEWREHQREVWRERQQRRRALQEAEEQAAEERADDGTEDEAEVRNAEVIAPSDDSYIHPIDNDLKRQLLDWHHAYSKEDLETMVDFECAGKLTDHGIRLSGILEDFVSTLLPDFSVAQLRSKLGTMKEAAYFRPQSGRATSSNPANAAEFGYIHVRLVIIPGKHSRLLSKFLF